MTLKKFTIAALLSLSVAGLAGCESSDKKAERLYQESVELAEEGQVEKAIVNLKSVFDLNGQHEAARMLYADLNRGKGDLQEAYRHYLLLTEQYPENLDARIKLAEMAMPIGEWEEVKRHATAAAKMAPDNATVRAILNATRYRDLSTGTADPQELQAVVDDAKLLSDKNPEDLISRRILIDYYSRQGEFDQALVVLDDALALEPDNADLNRAKLSLLVQSDNLAGLGDQLKTMVARFPDDAESRSALVRWYLIQNDIDGAEQFIRDLVEDGGDDIPPRVSLVQFLQSVRGPEAALAEIDKQISEGVDSALFRSLRASIWFDQGKRDNAIAEMESILDGAETNDQTNNLKVTLARMQLAVGDETAADALISDVLEADAQNVGALKVRADRLIEQDKVRDAVLALRTALDQDPDDVEALTLLAKAYERDGNRELVGESLSLAVDASKNAPEESLRYAEFLKADEHFVRAETVLINALQLAPANVGVLRSLGQTYLQMEDWSRARQVSETLRNLKNQEATAVASALDDAILQSTGDSEESISLLQSLVAEGSAGTAARAEVVRRHLARNDLEAARSYMDQSLAETDDPDAKRDLQYLNAALLSVEGNPDGAEAIYRDLLAQNDQAEAVWRSLALLKINRGQLDEAQQIVTDGIAANENSATLKWLDASLAERTGDYDRAIAIYEDLYAADSGSALIANNLASMITTYYDDQEHLERAFVVARRLRGTDVPAFQDTYGWIAFRLGNIDEALEYLESAAEGMPRNPSVQYHLGKVYAAKGRTDEARNQFERAVELWGDTDVPEAQDARQQLTSPEPAPEAKSKQQ
ncbi:tetratricopeptide repeat protein [Qingshengfaniella alkalisoli]|uniref:Tetratricopeptide repeat protein n=1 Tax=Qingshengfaniella alkalisoli TaxID=2599296 RepID=A0A5B8I9Q1_9RHOB|nr:tetratricopeptide repeat protein [Qingshengfaniella alkalisoli]QDY69766.1 tetratricopeptide repeat protein [Qingshengfaniella alkalisoli]